MKRLFALFLPAVCLAQSAVQVEVPVSAEAIVVAVVQPSIDAGSIFVAVAPADNDVASIFVAAVQPDIDVAPLSVIVKEPVVKSVSVVVTLDLEAVEKTMMVFSLADKYPHVSSDSPLGALIKQGNAEMVEAFFETRKKEGK